MLFCHHNFLFPLAMTFYLFLRFVLDIFEEHWLDIYVLSLKGMVAGCAFCWFCELDRGLFGKTKLQKILPLGWTIGKSRGHFLAQYCRECSHLGKWS